jgi:hypothetical protein
LSTISVTITGNIADADAAWRNGNRLSPHAAAVRRPGGTSDLSLAGSHPTPGHGLLNAST